ncbi:hypothetical protein HDA40_003827 [Hamadaea flava]|uniref:Anti-sigma-D factor RsdA sigma factor binding region domain-containing protein n=1 Tax=Hamadaea flava TaxID=1742688 RepID=A0ABV8LHT7_9ACTN|nr:hypothetical protein [Hamadaea flava]MCP2325320.1 hypothetical protein [Hamadaea flava]
MKIRNQGHFPDADPGGTPIDADQLARDDALLDLLGAGSPAPADDSLAVMLSSWQSSVAADEPEPVAVAAHGPATTTQPPRSARRPFSARLIAAIAGAVVVLGGGLTAGAATAGPGSPLWPITKIVYADRAAVQQATAYLDEAATAYADRRFADARSLTDKAAALLPKVTDAADRQRLAARIEQLRAALAAVVIPDPGASPTAPSGVAHSATPRPSGVGPSTTPAPSSPSPSPSPSQGGLLPLPPLPSLLPSLPSLPILG